MKLNFDKIHIFKNITEEESHQMAKKRSSLLRSLMALTNLKRILPVVKEKMMMKRTLWAFLNIFWQFFFLKFEKIKKFAAALYKSDYI